MTDRTEGTESLAAIMARLSERFQLVDDPFCACGEPLRHDCAHNCLDCAVAGCAVKNRGGGVGYRASGSLAVAFAIERPSVDCDSCGGSLHITNTEHTSDGKQYVAALECPGHRQQSNAILYTEAKIPARYAGATFATFEDRPKWRALGLMRDRLHDWTKRAKPGEPGPYLYGTNGVGKTLLMAAIAQHLTIQRGLVVRYASWPRMVQRLRDTFDKPDQAKADLLEPIASAPFLLLDEVGRASGTDWQSAELDELIDRRNQDPNLTTVCASNYSGSELETKIGARSASRLAQMTRVHNCTGSDYRRER
jgi:DNA replication protein DnaC